MNPNLPLPTDNLYKFCALAGVAIAMLSIYLPGTLAFKLNEMVFEIHMDVVVMKVEGEYDRMMVDDQKKIFNDLLSGIKTDQLITEGKLAVPTSPQDFWRKHEAIFNANKNASISVEKSKIKLDHARKLLVLAVVIFIIGIISTVLGLKLAIYGFNRWYTKIQIPLDRLIENDAQLAGAREPNPKS